VSIRVFTNQQFAEGTTIDGNRVEMSLQQLEKRVDTVPYGDVKTRWMQTQYVMGWNPITTIAPSFNQHPWLRTANVNSDVWGSLPDHGIMNPERLKGIKNKSIAPRDWTANSDETLYSWTTKLSITSPAVLDGLDVMMLRDSVYNQPIAASIFSDVDIVIDIDSPFSPESRTQNAVELHRKNYSSLGTEIRPGALAQSGDMLPSFSAIGGDIDGSSLNLSDLNIPLYPGSRLRISMIIPLYDPLDPGYGAWGVSPWRTFVPGMVISLLEPVTNG